VEVKKTALLVKVQVKLPATVEFAAVRDILPVIVRIAAEQDGNNSEILKIKSYICKLLITIKKTEHHGREKMQ